MNILLYLIALAVIVGVSHWSGRAACQKGHVAEKVAAQAKYDRAVASTERIERLWREAVEERDEWVERSIADRTLAADVAKRMRDRPARRCPLPNAPAAPGGGGSPGEEPGEPEGTGPSDLTVAWHFENCAADAADFDRIRTFYNELRATQALHDPDPPPLQP